MSDTNATRWIRFLRQYGPAAQNDSMYDEQIRKLAKRLDVPQLVFEHPIESRLLGLFSGETPEPRSVILTGTAGDGKSNLCGKVWARLGGDPDEWDSPEVYFQIKAAIGGKEVVAHVVRDLTGIPPSDARGRYGNKDELLQKLSSILVSPYSGEIVILAANDGQLVDIWRSLASSYEVLQTRALFDKLLDENKERVEGCDLEFFHLSRLPSLQLFDLALKAFVAHPGWRDCYSDADEAGFFGTHCPVRHNYELLQEPLIQKRLRSLMRLCDHSDLHVPIRRILLLLSNAVLGHSSPPQHGSAAKDGLLRPADVAKVIVDGTAAQASLFNNIFGGNLSNSRRESLEVFDYLNRFRIGFETSNRIDNILIFGEADENLKPYFESLMVADKFYGADASFRAAQRSYVEGGDEGNRSSERFLTMLVSQRRGLFFKIPEELEGELKLWELTAFKFAGEYLGRVVDTLESGGKVDRPILARLVKGLNRVFVGMLVDVERELLLASSVAFSGPSVAQLLEDRIPVAPRMKERIELLLNAGRPTLRVQLATDLHASLPLNLTRYEFLSRVAEGALPSSFSRECYEDFLAFKSQVFGQLAKRRAQEGAEEKGLAFKLLSLDAAGNVTDTAIEVVP